MSLAPVEMVSLRDVRIATTAGHIVQFEAKTPRLVPAAVVQDAMNAGCMPTDPEDAPMYEDMSRAIVDFQGNVRKSIVYLAVEMICKANEVSSYDAGGVPKDSIVSERVGFPVTREEVRDIHQIYLSATAEGRPYGLHPNAPNIIKILEADTKGELIDLGVEFGYVETKIKGMSARDLRKMLLSKFSGVAAS